MSNPDAGVKDSAPDLRLMKLNQELTAENQRLTEEVEKLGSKNVELVFKADDLEEQVQEAHRRVETLAGELQASRQASQQSLAELEETRGRLEAVERDSQEALRSRDELHARELEQKLGEREQLRELQLSEQREGFEARFAQQEQLLERSLTEQAESFEQRRQELEGAHGAALEEFARERNELRRQLEEAVEQNQRWEQEAAGLKAGWQQEAADLRQRLEESQTGAQRLGAELEERNARAAQLQKGLEQAQAELERRDAEILARGQKVEDLERLVQELKTQYLEKVQTSLTRRPARKAMMAGKPGEVLAVLAEEALGSTGKILVKKVFSRCHVEAETLDRADLEKVVDTLEAFAAELTTQDRLQKLRASLEQFRTYLDNPEASGELLEAVTESAAVREDVVEAPVPEPTVERVVEAHVEPTVERVVEARVEEPTVGRVAEARAEEPTVEEVPEEEAPPGELAEVPTEQVLRVGAEVDSSLYYARDPRLIARIEEGMKLLGVEKYEESLDRFIKLHGEAPDCIEVQTGLFFNYVGFSCWMEAYDVGRRISPVLLEGEDAPRFVRAMSRVLNERIEQTRNLAEKKSWLLELAELHMDQPPQALKYLRQAHRIPDDVPGDGRINFYLTRMLEDAKEDRIRYLHGYMARVADSPELFAHIGQIYSEHKLKAQLPLARAVLALGTSSRQAARKAESEAPLLATAEASPDILKSAGTSRERAVLELFLDRLLPASEVSLSFPSSEIQALLSRSDSAPADWVPARLALEANRMIFGDKLRVYRYAGDHPFLVLATPEPVQALILHGRLGALAEPEARFHILRELYGVHRRHYHLYRAGGVDDAARRKLMRACSEEVERSQNADIGPALQREIDRLLGRDGPIELQAWKALLDRLYNHTRCEEFRLLYRLFSERCPFDERLGASADGFASRLVGLTDACYAVAGAQLDQATLAQVEEKGFQILYRPPLQDYRELRLRVQRLMLDALLRT